MEVSPQPPSATPPRIAVIVPAYGVAHLVGEALDSLLAQSLTDWECVVVDDGAPDDVAGAVRPYLSDPRIRFVATANGGVSSARNRAIAESSAPCIALLDGDDLFRPSYLEQVTRVLEADKQARIVTCNARLFGAVEKERHCIDRKQGTGDGVTGTLADVLDRSFNIYIGSAFRRADFDQVGGFDEELTHAEDLDLWVRLLMLGGHVHYLNEVLGEYRVRPDSASASGSRMIAGNMRVYEKALAALETGPEAGIAHRMIAINHARLAFEEAIAQVEGGDHEHGLPALRAASKGHVGLSWILAFLLWRVLPQLAAPMLRWRRRSNSRGVSGKKIPPLTPQLSRREAHA